MTRQKLGASMEIQFLDIVFNMQHISSRFIIVALKFKLGDSEMISM
jgi:hypothetical protein